MPLDHSPVQLALTEPELFGLKQAATAMLPQRTHMPWKQIAWNAS
jgi:hypothetical protein